MSTLVTKEISKSYGGRLVVHDVSVYVEQGEVVGLLGPNGAGKTTTFYMIVGLISPDSGDILLDSLPQCCCRTRGMIAVEHPDRWQYRWHNHALNRRKMTFPQSRVQIPSVIESFQDSGNYIREVFLLLCCAHPNFVLASNCSFHCFDVSE